jgi:O-glycosyl hydrolase
VFACTSSETDPVSPPGKTTGARFSTVTPTATAWFYGSTPLQEIKGWGVYPSAGGDPFYWSHSVEDAVYRLGVTVVRDQLDPALYVSGTNVNNIVLNQSLLNQYIAKIAYAKAHGVQSYILAVWSPPARWKTNGSLLGASNAWLYDWAEPYMVAFVTKVMLALRSSRVGTPIAFSVQNEPSNVVGYPGCLYTPAQWQRIMQDVRGSFDYWGLSYVKLIGPEASQYTPAIYYNYKTLAPGYLGGPGYPSLGSSYLNYAVGAYSFHLYGQCSVTQTQQAIARHPKDMWMTEYGRPNGTTEIQWTIDMMSTMAGHLITLPVNYWFWWLGWAWTSGAPSKGQLLGGTTSPVYSKRYWALQKLFTTVRPGWHVVRLTTTDASLLTALGNQSQCDPRVDLIGFSSPDRSTAVVEIVNNTSYNKQIEVGGLPGSWYTSYRTDAWNDMVQQQSASMWQGNATISAPANSVVIAIMK